MVNCFFYTCGLEKSPRALIPTSYIKFASEKSGLRAVDSDLIGSNFVIF